MNHRKRTMLVALTMGAAVLSPVMPTAHADTDDGSHCGYDYFGNWQCPAPVTDTGCPVEEYNDPATGACVWPKNNEQAGDDSCPSRYDCQMPGTKPKVKPKPKPKPRVIYYRIKRGETLWRVAVNTYGKGRDERAGHKWTKIARDNRITDPRRVPAGKVLVVKF